MLQRLRPIARRPGSPRWWQAGTVTLEMAVVTPLLVAMLLLVADFGRVFYTAITLAHAARAGAQYGSWSTVTSSDTAGIQQAAAQEAQNIGTIAVASQRFCTCPGGAAVSCTSDLCGAYGAPQVYVQVTASKTFDPVTPGFLFIPDSVPLSQSATMRVQ